MAKGAFVTAANQFNFTLTYGTTRCIFAEILYRHVDDAIYGV